MGQAGDKLYRRKTWVTVTPAHRGMSVPGGPVCCLMQTPVRDGVMEGDWETTCLDLPRPGQECSVVTRAVWGQHYNITPLHHSDSDIGAEQSRDLKTEDSDYYSGDKRCEAVLVLARSSALCLTELSGNLRVP